MQEWLQNHNYIDNTNGNRILCPICGKAKLLEEFTEEHIIPASIGGKSKTITCKDCNSKCGHKYDYSLLNFINQQKMFIEKSNNKTEIFIGETKINATLIGGKSTFMIEVSPKNNNPNNIKTLCEELTAGLNKFKITQSSKWSPKSISKALLKIAHLMSVPTENYKFVLCEGGKYISKILLDEVDDDLSELIKVVKSDGCVPNGYYELDFDNVLIRTVFMSVTILEAVQSIEFFVILPGEKQNWIEFKKTAKKFMALARANSFTILPN